MDTCLFLYGTLKRGEANHHLVKDQRFLGRARTEPRFRLLDLGWYPGLAEVSEGGESVEGELYLVQAACLERLDRYEGEEYARRELTVDSSELQDHKDLRIEAYILLKPDFTRPAVGSVWRRATSEI